MQDLQFREEIQMAWGYCLRGRNGRVPDFILSHFFYRFEERRRERLTTDTFKHSLQTRTTWTVYLREERAIQIMEFTLYLPDDGT